MLTEGPLARLVSKDLSDTISSFHRRNVWVVIALVSAQIGAVLFYLFALNENLIKPMLDGAKMLPVTHAIGGGDEGSDAMAGRAAVLFALCAAAVWLAVTLR